jgi:ATP-dependent exoDNAse (exonuclease V) alpha subunit
LRAATFKDTTTIASALHGLEDGRTAWNKKTVLVVDEAAMIGTDHLAKLTAAADKAGAKLILAGDDKQLGSIERGGMFETLRQQHGAAILTDVQRVKEIEQKTAFNQMHRGEFRGALETFDKAGGIHWTEKQGDALREMAKKYTEDVKADPGKKRFMFAYSNAEVAALNTYARAVHRERGDLGADYQLNTAHGEATFATGDRIQFSGNGYGRKGKDAGLTNGRVGTIIDIDTSGEKPRVTVQLDGKKGDRPKEISFTVGDNGRAGEFDRFKHGYAGTIYRGQGRTLDTPYVCHSSQWRRSAAYVALTRHRESVQIFAARETVADLDAMAKGLQRTENKRAATAYEMDPTSALRMEFDGTARAATSTQRQAPESSRGLSRSEAFLEAERQRKQVSQTDAAKGQADRPEPGRSPPLTSQMVADHRTERAEASRNAQQQDREARKAALRELSLLFGRELSPQEGDEVQQTGTRGRGGGQSL